MTPDAITAKLRLIERLTAEELDGWRGAIADQPGRPFDGERAALMRREAELKRGAA